MHKCEFIIARSIISISQIGYCQLDFFWNANPSMPWSVLTKVSAGFSLHWIHWNHWNWGRYTAECLYVYVFGCGGNFNIIKQGLIGSLSVFKPGSVIVSSPEGSFFACNTNDSISPIMLKNQQRINILPAFHKLLTRNTGIAADLCISAPRISWISATP